MPSNEQRREAARRKLERQLERRIARAKRNRIVAVTSTVAVTLLVVGGIYYLATKEPGKDTASTDDPAATTTTPMPQGKKTDGGCAFEETPTRKAAKEVGLPEDPKDTPKTGTVAVNLKTSQGEIPLTLDRAKAPCAVQSFVHLAKARFFDSTECHRMTSTAGLKVLQCGDPTAQGTGGPGYQFKDETPPGGPHKAPDPNYAYKRGVLAMANSGPGTNGSQFFMVYADSELPPNYTIFGTIGEPGLAVLDKVAAGGVEPGPGGTEDGKPKLPVKIETATAA